jgi:DNA gyrase inhibitor GyrI
MDVRIVKLEPMTVAVAHGFGEHPETESWEKMMAFARDNGLLDEFEARRVFGFNNPDPTPGSPNYGYDSWLAVEPGTEASGDIVIQRFEGGLYAVTPCDGVGAIGNVWRDLVAWREDSRYSRGHHQWLEEVLNPGDFVTPRGDPPPDEVWDSVRFHLYLPIAE